MSKPIGEFACTRCKIVGHYKNQAVCPLFLTYKSPIDVQHEAEKQFHLKNGKEPTKSDNNYCSRCGTKGHSKNSKRCDLFPSYGKGSEIERIEEEKYIDWATDLCAEEYYKSCDYGPPPPGSTSDFIESDDEETYDKPEDKKKDDEDKTI